VLQHEGKRVKLFELVCGNFVGVRGRKLDAIRAQLGSHGAHLRVNHQLVDADEVRRWREARGQALRCERQTSPWTLLQLPARAGCPSRQACAARTAGAGTHLMHRLSPPLHPRPGVQHHAFVAVQVSVLGLVMDRAMRLLLDAFSAAAHGVLVLHPRAGEISVSAVIAGQQVGLAVGPRGVARLGAPPGAAAAHEAADPAGTPLLLSAADSSALLAVAAASSSPPLAAARVARSSSSGSTAMTVSPRLLPVSRSSSVGSNSSGGSPDCGACANARSCGGQKLDGNDLVARLLIGSELFSLL
jgi:hypothetical protein